ncbi:hypothetical protein RJ639_004370 [Escallonia herrerae]|uniref:Translocon-associated protein subunit beta n=1 Tax=Escallonia herrerae TaxID=1293975 RepID=A0AA88W188_9ASTE|nr:hypothetical protein RJ639_004370 [Escallonia herrerae]
MASPCKNAPLKVVALLLALLSISATAFASDSPFIVAHKKVALKKLNPATEGVSVVIDIYNRGSVGSLVSHSFDLDSRVKTIYYGAPALITFRVPMKANLQEAYSTPILPLDVLADRAPQKTFDLSLLADYGSQISVIAIVAAFARLIAAPSKSNTANLNKKRH